MYVNYIQQCQHAEDRINNEHFIFIEFRHQDIGDKLADEKADECPNHIIGSNPFIQRRIELQGKADGERPHRGLHAHIQELRDDTGLEAAITGEIAQRFADGRLGFVGIGGKRFAARELGDGDYNQQYHQHKNDELIRLQGALQHRFRELALFIACKRAHLFVQRLAFCKNQIFAEKDTENRANRIEGLRNIQTQRRLVFRANHRRISIAGRFQERKSHGNGKQGDEKDGIGRHV